MIGEINFGEGDIAFTGKGVKEMSHTLANPQKILTIPYLDRLIKNATYATISFPHNKHDGWTFYYLHNAVSVKNKDGKTNKIFVIVTAVDKGNGKIQYYNHTLFDANEYKKIEDTSNELLTSGFSRPPKAHTEVSSKGIIYQAYKIYKKINKDSYLQMVGERANTAPEGKLQKAVFMEESEKAPEEIWKTTGWMRGPDHKWRFEIPDNLDKIDLNTAKDGKDYSLGEIYNNLALYEAYPELKGIQIRLEKINSTKGKQVRNAAGYVDEDGNIIIDKDLPVYKMKEVLVHEIQHIIQYKEGFSTGGNIYSAKEQIQDTIDKLQLDLQDIELKDPKAKAYMDKAEEIIGSFNTFDFNRAKQLNDERKALLETMSVEEREKLSTIERDMELLEDAAKQDDYAAYRRLGGEAEAFMTQGRADAQTRRQRDIDYDKESQERISRYEELKKSVSKEELEKLETLEKLESEREAYLKQPDHDNGKSIAMIKEIVKRRKEIPDQHYIIYASAREAKKIHVYPDLPMPNYDTPYGPAVINFAGEALPFHMEEPDLVALHNISLSNLKSAIQQDTPKEIKDYLKQHGAFIRLYDPKVEGDRERVTNIAQKRANQYFQNDGKYQGAYDLSQNMIELFDGANQSTVIHEGAHMFLSLLKKMENLTEEDIENYFEGDRDKAAKTSERVRKDLSTIREWAAFSEEHLEEYKGTVLEKEFNKHAEDIRNGVEGAEERWIQERFTRGFEKYLAEGYAPTKELRGVFRRFKSWLKDVYKSAKNLGSARLSPEIKDSFDHMISVAIESKGSL